MCEALGSIGSFSQQAIHKVLPDILNVLRRFDKSALLSENSTLVSFKITNYLSQCPPLIYFTCFPLFPGCPIRHHIPGASGLHIISQMLPSYPADHVPFQHVVCLPPCPKRPPLRPARNSQSSPILHARIRFQWKLPLLADQPPANCPSRAVGNARRLLQQQTNPFKTNVRWKPLRTSCKYVKGN